MPNLACLVFPRVGPERKRSHFGHLINHLLTKLAGYLPRSFFAFLFDFVSVNKNNNKKRTWPISSHLECILLRKYMPSRDDRNCDTVKLSGGCGGWGWKEHPGD